MLGERAGQLVGLADRDRPALGVGDIDGTEVDRTDLGRVVVEKRDKPELGHEVGHDLLGPFPPKSAEQAAVARVQVAADPDRVPTVQPRVAAGVRPAHQEPPRGRREGRDTG